MGSFDCWRLEINLHPSPTPMFGTLCPLWVISGHVQCTRSALPPKADMCDATADGPTLVGARSTFARGVWPRKETTVRSRPNYRAQALC